MEKPKGYWFEVYERAVESLKEGLSAESSHGRALLEMDFRPELILEGE